MAGIRQDIGEKIPEFDENLLLRPEDDIAAIEAGIPTAAEEGLASGLTPEQMAELDVGAAKEAAIREVDETPFSEPTVQTDEVVLAGQYKKPEAVSIAVQEQAEEDLVQMTDPTGQIAEIQKQSAEMTEVSNAISGDIQSAMAEKQELDQAAADLTALGTQKAAMNVQTRIDDIESQADEKVAKVIRGAEEARRRIPSSTSFASDNKLGIAIASFLSSFGAALAKRPDTFQTFLTKMLAAKSKERAERLSATQKGMKLSVEQIRKKQKEDISNERANVLLDLKVIEAKANRVAQIGKNKDTKVNALKLAQKANESAQKVTNQLKMFEVTKGQERSRIELQQGSPVSGSRPVPISKIQSKADRDRMVPVTSSLAYLAATRDDAKLAKRQIKTTKSVTALINDLSGVIDNAGGWRFLKGATKTSWEAKAMMLLGSLTDRETGLYNAGVIQPGDLANMGKFLPLGASDIVDWSGVKLRAVKKFLNQKLTNELKTSGINVDPRFFK